MAAKKIDPLATYNAKRDFAKTAEPAGAIGTECRIRRIHRRGHRGVRSGR